MKIKLFFLAALSCYGSAFATDHDNIVNLRLTAEDEQFRLNNTDGVWRSTSTRVAINVDDTKVHAALVRLAAETEETHGGNIYRYRGFYAPKLIINMKDADGQQLQESIYLGESAYQDYVFSVANTIRSASFTIEGAQDSFRCNSEGLDCIHQGIRNERVYLGLEQGSIQTHQPLATCEAGFFNIGQSWSEPGRYRIILRGDIPDHLSSEESFTNFLYGSSEVAATPENLPEIVGPIPDSYSNENTSLTSFRSFNLARTSETSFDFSIRVKEHRFCEFVKRDYRGSGSYRIQRISVEETCQNIAERGETVEEDRINQSRKIDWSLETCTF